MSYAFSGSFGARSTQGQRSLQDEFPALAAQLQPGMRVVDCGCGGGSVTLGIAALVAPGEVVGFDVMEESIADATRAAIGLGAANVRFTVADVFASGLDAESFDVAVCCNVLAHVREPERALVHVRSLLKPGGILATREMNKGADWYGGTHSEVTTEANGLIIDMIRSAGGDPLLGARLARLLLDAGFSDVSVRPSYSSALSTVAVSGPFIAGRIRGPGFTSWAKGNRNLSDDALAALAAGVDAWTASPDAVSAIAECSALARKA